MIFSRLLALVILVAAGVWLWSGQVPETQAQDEGDVQTVAAPPVQTLTKVRARVSRAQPYVRSISVRGETQADRTVSVMSEIDGRVTEVKVEKGDTVKRGQLLVRLATNERIAVLEQAKAAVKQRELEYEVATRLNKSGFRAETAKAQAKAALESALAEQRRAEVSIGHTRITAPFEGVIEQLPVELGAFLQKGGHAATIVDRTPMLIVAYVSEREVNNIKLGSKASARLVDGAIVDGTITYVSPSASDDTRTFRVEMETPNDDGSVRDGMTAELLLPVENTLAHFMSPAVLALNDAGQLGVRTLDPNNVVQFTPLSILGNDPKGIWVTGLGEQSVVITVGQEFVVPGQTVDVDLESDAGAGS